MPLDPPDTLNTAQQATWTETLQRLDQAGTQHRVDPHSLAAYVTAVYNWDRAKRLLDQSDILITRGTTAATNPAVAVMASCATTINQFAKRFRLNEPPIQLDDPAATHPAVCETCSQQHVAWRCPGHTRDTGRQCGNARGFRTDHPGYGPCKYHGGSAPTYAMHLAVDRERAAEDFYALTGTEPVGDPLDKMAELAGMRWAWMTSWVRRANALSSQVFTDANGVERLRAAANQVRLHANDVQDTLEAMAKGDVDERLVAVHRMAMEGLAAELVERFDAALTGILADLGHDRATAQVQAVVEQHTRAIAA